MPERRVATRSVCPSGGLWHMITIVIYLFLGIIDLLSAVISVIERSPMPWWQAATVQVLIGLYIISLAIKKI